MTSFEIINAKKQAMSVKYIVRFTSFSKDDAGYSKKTSDISFDPKSGKPNIFTTPQEVEDYIKENLSYFRNIFFEVVKVYVYLKGDFFKQGNLCKKNGVEMEISQAKEIENEELATKH